MIRTRVILLFALMLPLGGLLAQETTTATSTETATATAGAESSTTTTTSVAAQAPESVREEFTRLLNAHPPAVARIVAADPTMLSNEPFVARYPDLADFLAKHSEVRRNPHYYTQYFDNGERHPVSSMDKMIEAMTIISVIGLIAFALAWLVRTVIEQRRWNRLSRTQTEVHNKILDRFGSSEEVLAYIKSPAGSKFLESAPIPLHAETATPNAPTARILWSIQLGVVVTVAALGLILVSLRFEKEAAQGFFAMGAIALSIGAGFIASAIVSLLLSRRLGVWQEGGAPPLGAADESGHVR